LFVREVDGAAVDGWFQNLTVARGLSAGTAIRHFNVIHHMMEKDSTIWSKETGIDRKESSPSSASPFEHDTQAGIAGSAIPNQVF